MQTTPTPIPGAPASSPPPPPGAPASRGARAVPITIGAVIAVLASLFAVAGAALLFVFGSDGAAKTGTHTIGTPTHALVSETATISDTTDLAEFLGDTRIRISADAISPEHGVFVGIARASDVDRYLKGASVDRVTDVETDPFTLTRKRIDGDATPGAPGDESFWVAKSSSDSHAAVDWKIRDGGYRIVIMNADGAAGVTADSQFGVKVPVITTIAWVMLIGGVLFLAGGITLIVVGSRKRTATTPQQPPAAV
jgi:flagellar basal body-associated protein FliL